MAGSLRKRPELGTDAWELRVFLGRDKQGRVRHKSRTFRGSKRAAEKELRALLAAQTLSRRIRKNRKFTPGARPRRLTTPSRAGKKTVGMTSAR